MGIFDKLKQGIDPESNQDYDEQDAYTQQIQNDFGDSQMYNQNTQQNYGPVDQNYGQTQPQDAGMQVSEQASRLSSRS